MQFKGDRFYRRVSRQSACYGRQFTRESKYSLMETVFTSVSVVSLRVAVYGRQFSQTCQSSIYVLREAIYTRE